MTALFTYLITPLVGTIFLTLGIAPAALIVNSMRQAEERDPVRNVLIASGVYALILFACFFIITLVPPLSVFTRILVLVLIWFCFRPSGLFEFFSLLFFNFCVMMIFATTGVTDLFIHLILPPDAGFGCGIEAPPEEGLGQLPSDHALEPPPPADAPNNGGGNSSSME